VAEAVAALRPEQRALGKAQGWLAVHRRIQGKPGSEVVLTLVNGAGRREVRLQREISRSHGVSAKPSFRRLDGRTGLLTITTFYANLDTLFEQAFAECGSCSSMIIDLRGNSGGFAHNIVKLFDRLMAQPEVVGIEMKATGESPLAFTGSGAKAFRGRVVALVDGKSASAAEVTAAALQDLRAGRDRVLERARR
jgi:carboxyl-terminal processing protease